jgi:hypothetical protein
MKKVFCYYGLSLLVAIAMIVVVNYFRDFYINNLMVLIGNGLLFSGTLGYLGQWSVQTWDGNSLNEKINKFLLILFYTIGFGLILLFS